GRAGRAPRHLPRQRAGRDRRRQHGAGGRPPPAGERAVRRAPGPAARGAAGVRGGRGNRPPRLRRASQERGGSGQGLVPIVVGVEPAVAIVVPVAIAVVVAVAVVVAIATVIPVAAVVAVVAVSVVRIAA